MILMLELIYAPQDPVLDVLVGCISWLGRRVDAGVASPSSTGILPSEG